MIFALGTITHSQKNGLWCSRCGSQFNGTLVSFAAFHCYIWMLKWRFVQFSHSIFMQYLGCKCFCQPMHFEFNAFYLPFHFICNFQYSLFSFFSSPLPPQIRRYLSSAIPAIIGRVYLMYKRRRRHHSDNARNEYNAFWHVLRIIGFCLSFGNSCANPIALYFVSAAFRKHFNR